MLIGTLIFLAAIAAIIWAVRDDPRGAHSGWMTALRIVVILTAGTIILAGLALGACLLILSGPRR